MIFAGEFMQDEFPLINLLAVAIPSLLIPSRLLLVFCIPALMILSFNDVISPLFSIGDADIQIFDFVFVITTLRIIGPMILRKRAVHTHPILLTIGLFLGVLLVATLLTYYRFGEEVFIGELIAFLRFLAQVSTLFLIAYSIKTTEQLTLTQNLILYIGYGIAATIYLNIVLLSTDIDVKFGEVQVTEETIRYFGPLGDQIGFILLFFIYKTFIDKNLPGTLFFTGALFATGTRGAVIALTVGIIVMIFQMRYEMSRTRKKIAMGFAILAIFISFMVLQDVGGIQSRLADAHLEFGFMQRLTTIKLSLQVFLDNFLIGVGYTGFRYRALDYGAAEIFDEKLSFSPNYVATAGNQILQTATDGGILALLCLVLISMVALRTLKSAARNTTGEMRKLFVAAHVWFLSLLMGNLTAAWLLPGSLIAYLL